MEKATQKKRVRDLTREEKIEICKSKGMCIDCPLRIKNPSFFGGNHCLLRNDEEQIKMLKIAKLEEILDREVEF